MSLALVLTTVNAPHTIQLDGQGLAECLLDNAKARNWPGHMSAFFGEVTPELQIGAASQLGISLDKLKSAAKAFAQYSGETYPLAA